MITIFSCPKAFVGHVAVTQSNAIESWSRLEPRCKIILIGDDEGVGAIAAEFGLTHIPAVGRSEYGTPLVSSIFARAKENADGELMLFVNADMILFDDLLAAVQNCAGFERFLMIGQRRDVDIHERLDFATSVARNELRQRMIESSYLHGPTGMDFFGFRKGSLGELPPFAVGRPAWDNWLLWHTLKLGFAAVDVTDCTCAFHQNHDYSHVPHGRRFYNGPEGDTNNAIAHAEMKGIFSLMDATHVLDENGIRVARDDDRVRHRIDRLKRSHPMLFGALMSWRLRYHVCRMLPRL